MKNLLSKLSSIIGFSVESNQSVREAFVKVVPEVDIPHEEKVELLRNLGKDIHKENIWKIVGANLLIGLAIVVSVYASSNLNSSSDPDSSIEYP